MLLACYPLHDFPRARGSIFSGLHPSQRFFAKCNALVLLRHAAPDTRCGRNTWGTRESVILPGSKSLQQFRAGLQLGQAENAVPNSSRESRVVRLI